MVCTWFFCAGGCLKGAQWNDMRTDVQRMHTDPVHLAVKMIARNILILILSPHDNSPLGTHSRNLEILKGVAAKGLSWDSVETFELRQIKALNWLQTRVDLRNQEWNSMPSKGGVLAASSLLQCLEVAPCVKSLPGDVISSYNFCSHHCYVQSCGPL